MGCNSSKNKIHVSATGVTIDSTAKDPRAPKPTKAVNKQTNRDVSASSKKSRRSAWDSQESLRDDGSGDGQDNRGGSATSKISKRSMDSGFDDEEYARVITESSRPEQIREVEEDFDTPRELDLGLVGQPCQQRLSAKNKDRLQEQRVMESLRNEGLITRPISKAAFGVSFDIVSANMEDDIFGRLKRPPPRLAKLEKRKKKKPMTEKDIERKLAKAEQRRKELEQQRLAKIQSVSMKSDVHNALDAFASRQKDFDTEVKSKEEQALENREMKLRERQEKMRRKKEHAEAVRRRKMLAMEEGHAQCDDEDGRMTRLEPITDETPVGMRTSVEY